MSFLKKGLFLAVLYGVISSAALAANHTPGEYVYNVARNAYATILGVASDGTYVIQFDSGTLQGQTGSGWTDADLAFTKGCQGRFCVGDAVYNIPNEAFANIIGLQNNGDFAIAFTSGTLVNQTGSNWTDAQLGKTTGCSTNLCVGEIAYNIPRQAQVTIIAIESDGDLDVRFTDGTLVGQTGSGWTPSQLVLEQVAPQPPGPAPQPLPPQPQPGPGPGPQPQPPRPQPPAPQPAPPAQMDCVIRSGNSADGQQTFNVMLPDGAILGTFSTSAQAAQFAETDPRCRS